MQAPTPVSATARVMTRARRLVQPVQRPPGPPVQPVIGRLPRVERALAGHGIEYMLDPLKFLTRMSEGHGPISHARLGIKHVYMLSDPALIHEVMIGRYREFCKGVLWKRFLIPLIGMAPLSADGEAWQRYRKMSTPPLQRKHIAGYADEMVACTERMVAEFSDGETRDIYADMSRLTLDIVSRCLFGQDTTRDATKLIEALDAAMENFARSAYSPRFLLPHWLDPSQTLGRAAKQTDEIAYAMIDRCRAEGATGNDLLSRLIHARDDDGEAFTDREIRDHIATMLFAGYETTAISLAYTLAQLFDNRQVAERLRAEVDRVLGQRTATFDDVPQLPYADAVFKEALRLYPPVYAFVREPTQDLELGGFTIPRGSILILSPYVMQRKARYYRDPEAFRPERWLSGETDDNPRFAYFPFASGARVCLGIHFAKLEAVLVLVTLMQRLSLQVEPGFQVAPATLMTLRPATGLKVIVERR